MLRTFTLCFSLTTCSLAALAQPQITASYTFPAVGYSDSIRIASGTNVGPSGSGVTWDFSGLTTTTGGYFSIVNPTATPYSSTFPSATHAIMLNITGVPTPLYEYYKIDATGWNIIASGYNAASTNNNYTPNNKLRVPYPFSFGASKMDTFQKVGGSQDGYTITYDGWGTLKVPGATYNNVVRLKYQWIGGEIAYNWFSLSPLFFATTWSQDNGGTFTFLGRGFSTGVNSVANSETITSAYPTPARESAFIQVSTPLKDATCIVYDVSGRIVRSLSVSGPVTEFKRESLTAGMYFYQIQSAGTIQAVGKVIFE